MRVAAQEGSAGGKAAMNHTSKCQLLVLMDENPGDLTDQQLDSYRWLIEQLLQEVQQHRLQRHTNPELQIPSTL